MADEEKQKELQQKYLEFQMLDQQTKQAQKQLQMIEAQMQELINTGAALDDISNVKQGTDFLAPIASGIFVRGRLSENKDILVNVGANVAVSKSVEEVKGMLKSQLEELENVQQNTADQYQMLTLKAEKLEKELQKLIE
jgi:prefoldin alpha subunit